LAKKLAKELYLHNNLKHINIKNDHDYSALFVVNTPITDNSGIAHCVEHLIFRASKAFPHATTLFQLTALTNVKINASTLADTTYFHCQSPCLESFNLALNYLLNGMFSPLFRQEDLNKEIHDGNDFGVIYRELIGLKNEAEQQDKQLINKNNAQANNSYNYSGDSQLIGKLSLNDLQNFHQQHYQASNITLVTANADIEQVSRLMSQVKNHRVNLNNKYSHNNTCQNSQEASSQEKISKPADDKQQRKYSQEINELIAVYYQWLQTPYNQNINQSKAFDLAVFEQTILEQTTKLKSFTEHGLIVPLVALSQRLKKQYINYPDISNQNTNDLMSKNKVATKPNKPKSKEALPSLFNKLYFKAKSQLSSSLLSNDLAYVYDKHNALLLVNIGTAAQTSFHIMSYIINAYPKFLAPRCQGLCYATQALMIQEITVKNSSYLAIYSAFDCSPDLRLKSMIKSILQLSHDIHFIQKSLLLAKIKYCRKYHVEMRNINNITALTISTSLHTIINKAPS